jgi:hypothetical protein
MSKRIVHKIVDLILAFFMLWAIYLILFSIVTLFALLVVSPIINFFRLGFFVFIPNVEFAIKMCKAVVLGSFSVTFVMWVWSALSPEE